MWSYYPELLETPVPRYTSYPTAADFGKLPENSLQTALENARGDVSLYVHIPFCERICFYCGCNTGASGKRQRVGSYLAALHAEIQAVGALLPREAKVRRIAFGGGSPNAILPSEFLDLVDALNDEFLPSGADWSIELDPRTMSAGWASAIKTAGISRASMGVQTFASHCQKAIGREQSETMIWRSTDWLRNAGVSSLNFDLMYGLPHQTRADLAESLEETRQFGADRIALFGYAHVPQIVKRQRVIDEQTLPGRDDRFAMAQLGFEYLTSHGYQAIGFDHFATPSDPMAVATLRGNLRRNFQGFTDDRAQTLIGLGASAISVFPDLIAQNEKNSGRYRMMSSQGLLTASTGTVRSHEDKLRGKVIEDLLCRGEAELTPCLYIEARPHLSRIEDLKLVQFEGLTLKIAPAGLPYARVVASLFDKYRSTAKTGFSAAI